MNKVVTLLALFMATTTFADGFICESTEQDLNVKVFHNTQPEEGTRVASIMVLSDPNISYGRKTIATFQASHGVLSNQGASYLADVDLRFKDSNRKGELIAGTKLGELDSVALDVDFSYAAPVFEGEEVDGKLILVKRNGAVIEKEMSCYRYLKN